MKTKQTESVFLAWFETQAGKSPSGTLLDAAEQVNIRQAQFLHAKDHFRAHQDYALKKQFALYAWMARDYLKDKPDRKRGRKA